MVDEGDVTESALSTGYSCYGSQTYVAESNNWVNLGKYYNTSGPTEESPTKRRTPQPPATGSRLAPRLAALRSVEISRSKPATLQAHWAARQL